MIKLGIIGYPLTHSLSPVMHKAALQAMEIEGDYEVMETEPEDIISRLKYLKTRNFQGFNITIPLKTIITPFLISVDDYANIAGAVNTVVIDKNKDMHGYNTDVYGFINAISETLRTNLKAKTAVVLGAGGAARAVAVGLAEIGINDIVFYARNKNKAIELKSILNRVFPEINVTVKEFSESIDLKDVSILVNTTPVGMEGFEQKSPISKKSVETLPNDAIVYDLIYKPSETELLKFAKECNLTAINGLEMLVLQGARALSLWIEQEVPVDIMRKSITG